jgi:uncharacterized repeat protein (TIGR03803 family)
VLYSFTGGGGGDDPFAGIIIDDAGTIYGTTFYGGDARCDCGLVFQLVPTGTTWTFSNLYSFHDYDGASPESPLSGGLGDLRGTTGGGGLGYGTTFHLFNSGTGWTFVTTRRFNGSNGYIPMGPLAGIFGTSYFGGSAGLDGGVLFHLMGGIRIQAVHSFTPTDKAGYWPEGGLVSDVSGNLYGTTSNGAAYNRGAVFEFYRGLIMDGSGYLYGTTYRGGASDAGVVYQFSPGTTAIVTSDENPAVVGQTVVLSATVTANPPRSGIPTGTVKFMDGTTQLGTLSLDEMGHASFPISTLTEGMHAITLSYSGNGNFNPSTSSVLNQQIGIPAVTLSANRLAFRAVIDSTSAPKGVSISNTGSAPLTFSGITAGDYFTVSSTSCGTKLNVGAKCTIYVTFTAASVGNVSGTLNIFDNAPTSPQAVSLSAVGLLPVSLTPTSAKFPATVIGATSMPKTFLLTNNLIAPLNSIVISSTGDFKVSGTTCSPTLAGNSKCAIEVVFTPTALGSRTGVLNVSDSALHSPQTSILAGTGN